MSPTSWRSPAPPCEFDLCSTDSADLDVISEELGLHELAVEDVGIPTKAAETGPLPRPTCSLMVRLRPRGEPGRVQLGVAHEINVFLTRNAMVTVRADDEVRHRRGGGPVGRLAQPGRRRGAVPAACVLDYVVDFHFQAIQDLDYQDRAPWRTSRFDGE